MDIYHTAIQIATEQQERVMKAVRIGEIKTLDLFLSRNGFPEQGKSELDIGNGYTLKAVGGDICLIKTCQSCSEEIRRCNNIFTMGDVGQQILYMEKVAEKHTCIKDVRLKLTLEEADFMLKLRELIDTSVDEAIDNARS